MDAYTLDRPLLPMPLQNYVAGFQNSRKRDATTRAHQIMSGVVLRAQSVLDDLYRDAEPLGLFGAGPQLDLAMFREVPPALRVAWAAHLLAAAREMEHCAHVLATAADDADSVS